MDTTYPAKVVLARHFNISLVTAATGIALTLIPPMQAAAAVREPAKPADLAEFSIEEPMAVEVFSASKFIQKTTEAPAAVAATDITTATACWPTAYTSCSTSATPTPPGRNTYRV